MEAGLCRWGRIGGALGSKTTGYGRFFDDSGAGWSRGGNRGPLADQKAVCGNAERGMVMEAPPPSTLVMAEPDLLFQVPIVPLDAPAQLHQVHQVLERDVLG